ncbi:hypothetical protein JCM10213_000461 [Rhodosporidiobolus nylandii]
MSHTHPIAIGSSTSLPSSGASPSLPAPLQSILQLRAHATSLLSSPALASELATGQSGAAVQQAGEALSAVLDAAEGWKSQVPPQTKLSSETEARGEFCAAWALSRIGELEGGALADRLLQALERFSRAAQLLGLPQPPELDAVPSVTRPGRQAAAGKGAADLPEVPAWAAEMLAEWARAQAMLAFSGVLGQGGEMNVREEELAGLLDIACRRNVQALFTPIDPLSSAQDVSPTEASTVLGTAHLIQDLASLLPFTLSPSLWARHLSWATHVADVRFVTASLSANRLVDEAALHAQALQNPQISPAKRKEVKRVLEQLSRRIAPFERTQGNVLLRLGRVMLDAVGALHLGRTQGFQMERRARDGEPMPEDEEDAAVGGGATEVPEIDLVTQTRQVLIRAAALFENAYASTLRASPSSRRRRTELRLLRRLEATYLDLELLDNSSPEVLELRQQRIERALFINSRLVALGDGAGGGDEDGADGSDDEDEEEESSDEEDGVTRELEGRLRATRIV